MACNHSCPEHCPPRTNVREPITRQVYISDEKVIDTPTMVAKTQRPFMLHKHKRGEACGDLCTKVD